MPTDDRGRRDQGRSKRTSSGGPRVPRAGSDGKGADRGRAGEGNRGAGQFRDRGPRKPRSKPAEDDAPKLHLAKHVIGELQATARPGKGDILVKVFSDAAASYMEEDYEETIRLAEQAKHMALRAAAARELLGLAYYRVGRWSDAAKELAAFRRISGSTEQNPVLADTYRALGKPEKSLEYADEIDRTAVDEAFYYEGAIVAAGALADMKRLDEAIARLEALDLRPEVAGEHHLRAWYVLGDLLERKGRFTQAREWFEAVAAADADITDAPQRVKKLT